VNRNRLLVVAKWVWLVLVLGGVAYYFAKHYSSFIVNLRGLSFLSLVFSITFLVIGKILLTFLSLWSIEGQEWHPSFAEMFKINAVTQLGKYIPGGIWHFVGRFGYYRAKGMTTTQSGRAMLVENLWLVLSAFCFGSLVGFFGLRRVFQNWLNFPSSFIIRGILFLFFILVWFLGMFLIQRYLQPNLMATRWSFLRTFIVQASSWMFIGLSFWIILPIRWSWELLGASVGGFALSWVVGYVAVFAPGGLGVREVLLCSVCNHSQIDMDFDRSMSGDFFFYHFLSRET
jgi:hypothetical protein